MPSYQYLHVDPPRSFLMHVPIHTNTSTYLTKDQAILKAFFGTIYSEFHNHLIAALHPTV